MAECALAFPPYDLGRDAVALSGRRVSRLLRHLIALHNRPVVRRDHRVELYEFCGFGTVAQYMLHLALLWLLLGFNCIHLVHRRDESFRPGT